MLEISFGPQPLLQLPYAILLVPRLPMGALAIAAAVVSGFAFDTAGLSAFGKISITMSTIFTDYALKPDQTIIRVMHCLTAAPSMPKQSLGNRT